MLAVGKVKMTIFVNYLKSLKYACALFSGVVAQRLQMDIAVLNQQTPSQVSNK